MGPEDQGWERRQARRSLGPNLRFLSLQVVVLLLDLGVHLDLLLEVLVANQLRGTTQSKSVQATFHHF